MVLISVALTEGLLVLGVEPWRTSLGEASCAESRHNRHMRGDLSYLTLEAFSFSTTHSRTRMEAGFALLTTIYPIILMTPGRGLARW